MPRNLLLAGGALAAGLTLTACGSGGGTAPSAPSPSAPAPSCLQQYRSWNFGPAHAAGENLVAALNGVQAATLASDVATTGAALKRAAVAATALGHYPIPRCADPKGYWRAVIARIQAAAHDAGTSNGQAALRAAEAALKDMPALDRELAAELMQTVPGLYKKN